MLWWFLSPKIWTYRHYWRRALFPRVFNKTWELLLIDRCPPQGAYIFLLCQKLGECVEVCLPLDTSTKRPAASTQHKMPENKQKGIEKLPSKGTNKAVGWNQNMQIQKQKRRKKRLQMWHPFFLCVCVRACVLNLCGSVWKWKCPPGFAFLEKVLMTRFHANTKLHRIGDTCIRTLVASFRLHCSSTLFKRPEQMLNLWLGARRKYRNAVNVLEKVKTILPNSLVVRMRKEWCWQINCPQ